MDIAISLVITLITALIVYFCFNRYGFIQGLLVTIVISAIELYIKNGIEVSVLLIFVTLLTSFLSAAINYLIFEKTETFYSYFILSVLAGLALTKVMDIATEKIIKEMIVIIMDSIK